MNRSDLIDALKDKESISRIDAKNVVDIFYSALKETLIKSERVEIRGFGSFTVKKYKAYTARNPKTGEKVSVPSKKLPFFKVGKELKELVDHIT